MATLLPYQQGLFDYNECFFGTGGFLSSDSNEEKHMMSFYMQVLAQALSEKNVVFGGNESIKWLEPGIGDGSSTKKFLQAVGQAHKSGFVVYGSDIQEESVNLAKRNLSGIRGLNVQLKEVLIRDAFSGEKLANEQCDFALCSHFIYHVKNSLDGKEANDTDMKAQVNSLVKGITDSVAKNGIVLMFHEGHKSDMFGNIGKFFGSSMYEATQIIENAAQVNKKEIVSMPLESKLHFPTLRNNTIELFKNVDNWKSFTPDSPEASWLKKFLFALHEVEKRDAEGKITSLGGARTLEQKGILADAINHTKTLLDKNGGYIVIRSEMQAILNNPDLKRDVESAFNSVKEKMPEIKAKTFAAINQARAQKKTA